MQTCPELCAKGKRLPPATTHLYQSLSTVVLISVTCISQGLKAVDSSIKESDLPAADPNTPIPLKYDAVGACAAESSISSLLERGQSNFSSNYYLPEQEVSATFMYAISLLLLNEWMIKRFYLRAFFCLFLL